MPRQIFEKLNDSAYLLLTLAALFWAGNFVMGRGVSETVPPMALSFWRWFLASLILLPFAWPHLKRDWPVIKAHAPYFLAMGFFGGTSFNALTYLALHSTTATNALVLNSANAMLILLANFFINSTRAPASQIVAILIAMAGMLYIITQGDYSRLSSLQFNFGDLLVIASMVGWAIYTAMLKKGPKLHTLSFTAAIFLASTLLLVPLIVGEHLFFTPASFDGSTLAAILYAAIFPGLLAYLFYNRGVALIGGNRAGIMIYLVPLFGALLAILLLGEQPALYHAIGFALIITGVVISRGRDEKRRNKKPPAETTGGGE